MKKRTKIIIAVCSAVVVLLVGGLGFAGNYFFDYALVRAEDGSVGGSDRDVANVTDVPEDQKAEQLNREMAGARTEKWLETADKQTEAIQSADGLKLTGTRFTAAEPSHKWVVAVHGYTSKQQNMWDIACRYAEQGYNILTPDLRSHGDSEGQYIGMGWLDRKDLLLWIDKVVEWDPDAQIVLHGVSMGAVTVMMVSGETLPSQVKTIVEDCGYTDVRTVFATELKLRFGLPEFPLMDAFNLVGMLRAGYSINEASALEQVRKATVPMLFIHGDADDFIPVEMVDTLYDAAPVEKDKLIVHGAGHAAACHVDPDGYYGKVFEFTGRYIGE